MDETWRRLSRPPACKTTVWRGWSPRTMLRPRAASCNREVATVPPQSHTYTQKRNTDCRSETLGHVASWPRHAPSQGSPRLTCWAPTPGVGAPRPMSEPVTWQAAAPRPQLRPSWGLRSISKNAKYWPTSKFWF